MDPTTIIPNYQPLPLPAPLWLLQTLLVVGFFLHVIPMNMTLGGSMLSSFLLIKGGSDKTSYAFRAGKGLASALPICISFAITQGIVPLLFLQLLYGPAYYTSSIVMAVPWISLLGLLLICYYGTYLITYRVLHTNEHADGSGIKAGAIMLLVALGLAAIGFLFSNNMTLMLTPEKWVQLYKSSASGLHLNLGERQLWPRYLHFALSAVAVGGLTLGAFGLYFSKREPEYSTWLIKTGSRIVAGITALQVLVGFAFLFALPAVATKNLLGGEPIGALSLAVSVALSVVVLVSTSIAAVTGSNKAFLTGMLSTIVVILTMIVTRHMLRVYSLHPHFQPDSLPVSVQWDILIAFLVCAAGLIAYLTWLTRTVWRAFNPPEITFQPKVETTV
jgi:hypothetical protein